MKQGSLYIVVYDLSPDKERSKAQQLLQGYGFAIQRSVFGCLLTGRLKQELLNKLEGLTLESGFVKLLLY